MLQLLNLLLNLLHTIWIIFAFEKEDGFLL